MKEQVSVDKSLKDPTDKIKQALEKVTFVKNKIYINADAHTFQPHMIEIINLLADALNICTDNIINDPYQRIRQAALIYKDEYEHLKRLHENVKALTLGLKQGLPNLIEKRNEEMLKQIIELLESLYSE